MTDKLDRRHDARKNYSIRCPVCGVAPGHACVQATKRVNSYPEQDPTAGQFVPGADYPTVPVADPRDTSQAEAIAFAEHELIGALLSLKRVKPNHYLVLIIEAVLAQRQGDNKNLPSLMQRQAD